MIPHPPLANWLLHIGLAEKEREALTFSHEFEHLQTLPFNLIGAVLLSSLAFSRAHVGLAQMIFILPGSHSAWEAISEILTYRNDSRLYCSCYQTISLFPRIAFWFIAPTSTIIA